MTKKDVLLSIVVLLLSYGQIQLSMAQSAPSRGSVRSLEALTIRHAAHSDVGFPAAEMRNAGDQADAVALGLAKTKVYKFRSIDYPGAIESFVYDYDDRSAVGWAAYPGDDVIAFYFHANTYRFLDALPAASFIHGINASGQMVGTYYDSADIGHGFLYSGSTLTTIDPPGSTSTSAWGISDTGSIVGFYSDASGGHNSFLYKKGTFTTIEYPHAAQTIANGINSAGDIVGYYDDPAHGFLLKGGTYSSFDFPMAESTEAYAINDAGEIAGTYIDARDVEHGFTYSGGMFTQVDVPGAADTELYRIKNNKNVVGSVKDSLGEVHGFIGK
ncbi:MAG: hypothetical protein WA609_04765 [Terriglobales bacterium]